MAAKAVNQRHGWKDAMDIRKERIAEITNACMDVLRSMSAFDWNVYTDRIRAKGYNIELIRDKTDQAKVHGYRFKFGRTTIKASELGVGRNLTASKIRNTFRKLHPQTPVATSFASMKNRNITKASEATHFVNATQSEDSLKFRKVLQVDGKRFNIQMPTDAYDTMNNYIEVPDNGSASHTDIMNVAMLLFMNYLDAATSMSESCGGGGSPDCGWGRNKDEDDRDWARRCAIRANWLCKPIKRSRRR